VRRRQLATLLALPLVGWPLASCASTPSDAYVVENDPGHVEHVAGTDRVRVRLADGATERLRIETATVRRSGRHLVVPGEAVFVDPEGTWWVYTNPAPAVFERAEVDVVHQQDGRAVLSDGPAAGTPVVTVGVPELYGVEEEVGH
jgi:hypothetical protein